MATIKVKSEEQLQWKIMVKLAPAQEAKACMWVTLNLDLVLHLAGQLSPALTVLNQFKGRLSTEKLQFLSYSLI